MLKKIYSFLKQCFLCIYFSILNSTVFEVQEYWKSYSFSYYFFNTFLFMLFMLHIVWTKRLFKLVYVTLSGGKVRLTQLPPLISICPCFFLSNNAGWTGSTNNAFYEEIMQLGQLDHGYTCRTNLKNASKE